MLLLWRRWQRTRVVDAVHGARPLTTDKRDAIAMRALSDQAAVNLHLFLGCNGGGTVQ